MTTPPSSLPASEPDVVEMDAPRTACVVVRLSIPLEEFVLRDTLSAVPGVEFNWERVVGSGGGTVFPLVWARGGERDELEAALADDPTVERASLLAEFDGKRLYRIEWDDTVQLLVRMITNSHATIMDLSATARGWSLRVLYPSREAFSKAREFCDAHNLTFDIESIHALDGEPGDRYQLTPDQFTALTTAYERGYFEIPRQATLNEIAEELGVSHQALSERLRRAHNTLIEQTLFVDSPFDPRGE